MKPGNVRLTGDCRPVGEILARIGDKWSVLVVTRLGKKSLRFSELRRELHGISQKMLTTTLRGLERDGFVTRTVTPSIPPRVDYELTDLGRDLLVPVSALGSWAVRNKERVESARQAYDGVGVSPGHERQMNRPVSLGSGG